MAIVFEDELHKATIMMIINTMIMVGQCLVDCFQLAAGSGQRRRRGAN